MDDVQQGHVECISIRFAIPHIGSETSHADSQEIVFEEVTAVSDVTTHFDHHSDFKSHGTGVDVESPESETENCVDGPTCCFTLRFLQCARSGFFEQGEVAKTGTNTLDKRNDKYTSRGPRKLGQVDECLVDVGFGDQTTYRFTICWNVFVKVSHEQVQH